jgi:hypothetical protein
MANRMVDPVTAQQVVGIITGMGGVSFEIFLILHLFLA